MDKQAEITDVEQLLDRVEETAQDEEQVSLGEIVESIGGRSFGPLLLVPGVIMIVPGIGDIPGVTTAMAVVVVLVAGQLLFRRKHLWLPQWLLKRSVKRERIDKAIDWVRGPAKFVDRLIRPRLELFTPAIPIAIGCILVALVMPLMEVVPFGGMLVGAALASFGLALVAKDGLLALLAFISTAATLGVGVYSLL